MLNGAVGADMSGHSASTLWIGGTYDVPMGSLGSLVNASVARGIAQRTLENFIEDLAVACSARIDKRESEFMHYSLFARG